MIRIALAAMLLILVSSSARAWFGWRGGSPVTCSAFDTVMAVAAAGSLRNAWVLGPIVPANCNSFVKVMAIEASTHNYGGL